MDKLISSYNLGYKCVVGYVKIIVIIMSELLLIIVSNVDVENWLNLKSIFLINIFLQ